MKKNYFLATLLILAITVNSQAQEFVHLDDKEPVFHITFTGTDGGGRVLVDAFGPNIGADSVYHELDTVGGHAWGGGTFEDFTFTDEIVSSDAFEEQVLPAMFWTSYASNPDRPQGIAAYSNMGNGSYSGPRGTMPRTISCFIKLTDSTRLDTANGAWGQDAAIYELGAQGDPGSKVKWILDIDNKTFKFFWIGATDSIAPEVITVDEWMHFALTIPDGGARDGVKFYINGLEQELIPTDPASDVTTLNTKYSNIGWDGIFVKVLVNLWMADYRVYDTELSQTEVRKLLGLFALSRNAYDNQSIFNIYPVPNNGMFTIETEAPGVSNVVVRNMLGQIVHNQTVDQEEIVDISNLASGFYFVSLSDSKNNTQTKKILIN